MELVETKKVFGDGHHNAWTDLAVRYCQMLWMKVVCPWRDGAAEESVSGRPWLISMRLF